VTTKKEHPSETIAGSVESFIPTLLPYKQELGINLKIRPLSHRILEKLVPEYKFKLGQGLVEPAKPKALDIIKNSLEEQLPIPLIVNIGTSKWFNGTNPDRNIAGFSELLMFEQLSHLSHRVESVYPRGVTWTILAEDLTNEWLYSRINPLEDVKRNNQVYLESLNNMLQTVIPYLNLQVEMIRESDILQQPGSEISQYHDLLDQNQQLFREYFEAVIPQEAQFLLQLGPNNLDQETWEKYVSNYLSCLTVYQQLLSSGWNGGVHPYQREYYSRQFEKSGGDQAKNLEYISAYFGSVLARREFKFVQRAAKGKKTIKVAFLRYPKGTNNKEKTAITVSQHPLYGHGASHQRISPWAAITNLEYDSRQQVSLRVRPIREQDKDPELNMEINYAGVSVPVNIFSADIID